MLDSPFFLFFSLLCLTLASNFIIHLFHIVNLYFQRRINFLGIAITCHKQHSSKGFSTSHCSSRGKGGNGKQSWSKTSSKIGYTETSVWSCSLYAEWVKYIWCDVMWCEPPSIPIFCVILSSDTPLFPWTWKKSKRHRNKEIIVVSDPYDKAGTCLKLLHSPIASQWCGRFYISPFFFYFS